MSKVVKTSFLSNLLNSIIGVFVGIILVIGSMALLFFNEVRPNVALAAKDAVELTSANASSISDKPVWVKGALTTDNKVGDSKYLTTDGYAVFIREVQMFAYIEKEEERTTDNLFGGTTTEYTYSYTQEWTKDVPSSQNFDDKTKVNPQKSEQDLDLIATQMKIAGFTISNPQGVQYDGMQRLALSESVVVADTGTINNDYLYLESSAVSQPQIGDCRIAFYVLPVGAEGIMVARYSDNVLQSYGFASKGVIKTTSTLYRFFDAETIDEVVATLQTEHNILLWILRFVGFFLMTAALIMILRPIQAIANFIPFIGKLTGAVIFFASLVVALVISLLVIISANIVNNIFTLIVLIAVIVGIIFLAIKKAKSKAAQQSPATDNR